jgi:hypothetical protein
MRKNIGATISLAAARGFVHRPTVLLSRKCSCAAAGPKTKVPGSTKMKMRNILVLISLTALAACGGGGSGGAAAPASGSVIAQPAAVPSPPPAANPPTSMANADLALAGRLYKGDQRTPAGFDVETRPSNVIGALSTRHLKNTDLATGSQAISRTYEVCTNDMAQAVDWSERQATWQGQYSDIVEVNGDNHMFEVVRVPRADVSAMIRHRVFRCDYLDRSATDLRADVGAAGSMNQRPLTAGELEKLAEYLWQFTLFNNSDYVVESSTSSASGNAITQTIRLAQIERGSTCDTVNVSDWVHTMNASDGALTRTLTPVRSFKVKSTASGAEACTG